MIYMVEAALGKDNTDADWDEWYAEMKPFPLVLSVQGLNSAQRFKGLMSPPAYLAIYSIENADVMSSPSYKGIGGGNFLKDRWKPFLSLWTRNVYAGLDDAPDFSSDRLVLILDSDRPVWPFEVPVTWLESRGLDRTAPYRALASVPESDWDRLAQAHPAIRAFRPITKRHAKPLA